MTMALYVLVAVSGLIEAAMGISLALTGPGHFLAAGVPPEAWALLPGGRFLTLAAALACLAAAALHAWLLRGLLQDRDEAHPLLQAYGVFALLGGILLFLAFPNDGVRWAFLGLDALRGLLLAGLSLVVMISPNTVKELRLPSVRSTRVERVHSRVERGGEGRGRGRGGRDRGGDRGRDRGRGGRDRGRDHGRDRGREQGRDRGRGHGVQGDRGGARETGGRGREREPRPSPVSVRGAAPVETPLRGAAESARPADRRRGGRGRGRGSRGEGTGLPFADDATAPPRIAPRPEPPRAARGPAEFDDETFEAQAEVSRLRDPLGPEREAAGANGVDEDGERRRSGSRRGSRGGRGRRGGRRGDRGGREERETRGGGAADLEPASGAAEPWEEDSGSGDRPGDRSRERRGNRRESARPASAPRRPLRPLPQDDETPERDVNAAPDGGEAIDYSGHHRKKGRYSTGALFRPREKHERQQRGGKWQPGTPLTWGTTDDEGEGDAQARPPAARAPLGESRENERPSASSDRAEGGDPRSGEA